MERKNTQNRKTINIKAIVLYSMVKKILKLTSNPLYIIESQSCYMLLLFVQCGKKKTSNYQKAIYDLKTTKSPFFSIPTILTTTEFFPSFFFFFYSFVLNSKHWNAKVERLSIKC